MVNTVTICTKRTYNIQMTNGAVMEVESDKPLSETMTAKLLEEDSIIGTFIDNINILSVRINAKNLSRRKRSNVKRKNLAKVKNSRKVSGEKSKNILTPSERINTMITMEGEFTRLDYQKFLEDKGHTISDFVGHSDIESAVILKRIVPTGEKIDKGRKKYRITDVMPVEGYMLRKILKNSKMRRY